MSDSLSYKDTVEQEQWRTFTIVDDYKWNLLVIMLMVVHYLVLVMQAGAPRRKLFTQEWMEEKFG